MPSPKASLAKFDVMAGTTVNAGIDDANVPDVTHHMKETAYVAIMTPMGNPFDERCIWGAPVVYWGLPAVAKSDRIEQAANEANLHYQTIYPGQRQPEDFAGVLVPSPTGYVIECMLSAVRTLNHLGRGVIFLDEINNATRATESAMLGFIQKRVVGDVPLAPGVRLIAAANPPKWSVNGFKMAPPTANRFCHLQVKCPPHRDWIHHMISEDIEVKFDAKGTEDIIRSRWGSVYAHVKSMFTGYMESVPQALHQEPPTDSEQSGYNWGSPRSWKLGARMMATSRILGYSDDITQLLLEGCVGEGLAFDFMTWVRNADLPTPEEVLSRGWRPDMRRLDVAFAVLTSVTQYVVTLPDQQSRHDAAIGAWNLFNSFVAAQMGDMVVSAAQTLVNKRLSRRDSPTIDAAASPVIRYLAQNKLLTYVETTTS
jgi:hypothetical protein